MPCCKRFVLAFFAFVGLIVPGTLLLALLAAPANPAPLEQPGCERNLADAMANVAAMQARVKNLAVPGPRSATPPGCISSNW